MNLEAAIEQALPPNQAIMQLCLTGHPPQLDFHALPSLIQQLNVQKVVLLEQTASFVEDNSKSFVQLGSQVNKIGQMIAQLEREQGLIRSKLASFEAQTRIAGGQQGLKRLCFKRLKQMALSRDLQQLQRFVARFKQLETFAQKRLASLDLTLPYHRISFVVESRTFYELKTLFRRVLRQVIEARNLAQQYNFSQLLEKVALQFARHAVRGLQKVLLVDSVSAYQILLSLKYLGQQEQAIKLIFSKIESRVKPIFQKVALAKSKIIVGKNITLLEQFLNDIFGQLLDIYQKLKPYLEQGDHFLPWLNLKTSLTGILNQQLALPGLSYLYDYSIKQLFSAGLSIFVKIKNQFGVGEQILDNWDIQIFIDYVCDQSHLLLDSCWEQVFPLGIEPEKVLRVIERPLKNLLSANHFVDGYISRLLSQSSNLLLEFCNRLKQFIKSNPDLAKLSRQPLIDASAQMYLRIPQLILKQLDVSIFGRNCHPEVRALVQQQLLQQLEDLHYFLTNKQ